MNECGFGQSLCQLSRSLTFVAEDIISPNRTSVLHVMIVSAAQQNMRGRVGSIDIEMELAETDEVQVKDS